MATNEEIKVTINERFLELTDRFPDLKPQVYISKKAVEITLNIYFYDGRIAPGSSSNMSYKEFDRVVINEIFDYCEFILNFFGFKSFKIAKMYLTTNKFDLRVRFIK